MPKVTLEVDVDLDDVLERFPDSQLQKAFARKFGPNHADLELLKEVRRELLNRRQHAAIALIEGALTTCEVSDLARLKQYELAGRA